MSTTETQSIPVPEPGLTQEEVVQRARDQIPVLRERQEECERIGPLPDETSRDFIEAGFYRMLQPRLFGGYEFDLVTYTRWRPPGARRPGQRPTGAHARTRT